MGKTREKRFKKRDTTSWPFDLFEFLDIPRELVLDLPRVTMIGNLQVLIENYLGLQHYSTERVDITTKSGLLRIAGTNLGLSYISSDELLVRGGIESLELLGEEGKP